MQGGGADASEAGEDVVIELGGMMGGQTMLEEQYSESRALSVQDIERSVRFHCNSSPHPRSLLILVFGGFDT
jgi:hypothetical protein